MAEYLSVETNDKGAPRPRIRTTEDYLAEAAADKKGKTPEDFMNPVRRILPRRRELTLRCRKRAFGPSEPREPVLPRFRTADHI
jgi:hypothetical protein